MGLFNKQPDLFSLLWPITEYRFYICLACIQDDPMSSVAAEEHILVVGRYSVRSISTILVPKVPTELRLPRTYHSLLRDESQEIPPCLVGVANS